MTTSKFHKLSEVSLNEEKFVKTILEKVLEHSKSFTIEEICEMTDLAPSGWERMKWATTWSLEKAFRLADAFGLFEEVVFEDLLN